MKENYLQVPNKSNTQYIDSREVAEMLEKSHGHLLRDINTYAKYLTECKIGLSEFFLESQYKDASGKTNKNYQISKKGCEFLAHKLTGKKGVIFTTKYIERFHQMEEIVSTSPYGKFANQIPTTLSDALLLAGELAKQNELLTEENKQYLAKIEADAPKVKFYDEMVKRKELGVTIREFSKMIKSDYPNSIPNNAYYSWFRYWNFISNNKSKWNMPSQQMVKDGLMCVRISKGVNNNGIPFEAKVPVITMKGIEYFTPLILKDIEVFRDQYEK